MFRGLSGQISHVHTVPKQRSTALSKAPQQVVSEPRRRSAYVRSPARHAVSASAPQETVAATTPAEPRALPSTYKQLRATKVGESFRDVAQVVEVALPEPAAGQVLVRVTHAGINGGCETFRARGEYAFARNRQTGDAGFALGAEGAGVVEATGPGVEGLEVGQAVTFVGGAFAEYATPPAALCFPIPAPGAAEVALTISGLTAAVALEHTGDMRAGETVLVTAAAGGTGHFAVQLAHLAGCHVIATCGSEEKAAVLRELGADRIINHRQEDVAEVLRMEYPAGVDLAYEGVGGRMVRAAMANMAEGGRLLIVGYISEYPHVGEGAGEGSFSSDLFWGGGSLRCGSRLVKGNVWPKDRQAVAASKRRVFELHREGRLRALVDARPFRGLASIPDAVDHMLSGATTGKVVVEL